MGIFSRALVGKLHGDVPALPWCPSWLHWAGPGVGPGFGSRPCPGLSKTCCGNKGPTGTRGYPGLFFVLFPSHRGVGISQGRTRGGGPKVTGPLQVGSATASSGPWPGTSSERKEVLGHLCAQPFESGERRPSISRRGASRHEDPGSGHPARGSAFWAGPLSVLRRWGSAHLLVGTPSEPPGCRRPQQAPGPGRELCPAQVAGTRLPGSTAAQPGRAVQKRSRGLGRMWGRPREDCFCQRGGLHTGDVCQGGWQGSSLLGSIYNGSDCYDRGQSGVPLESGHCQVCSAGRKIWGPAEWLRLLAPVIFPWLGQRQHREAPSRGTPRGPIFSGQEANRPQEGAHVSGATGHQMAQHHRRPPATQAALRGVLLGPIVLIVSFVPSIWAAGPWGVAVGPAGGLHGVGGPSGQDGPLCSLSLTCSPPPSPEDR